MAGIDNLSDAIFELLDNIRSREAREYLLKSPLTPVQFMTFFRKETIRNCIIIGLAIAISKDRNRDQLLISLEECFSKNIMMRIKHFM